MLTSTIDTPMGARAYASVERMSHIPAAVRCCCSMGPTPGRCGGRDRWETGLLFKPSGGESTHEPTVVGTLLLGGGNKRSKKSFQKKQGHPPVFPGESQQLYKEASQARTHQKCRWHHRSRFGSVVMENRGSARHCRGHIMIATIVIIILIIMWNHHSLYNRIVRGPSIIFIIVIPWFSSPSPWSSSSSSSLFLTSKHLKNI